MSSNKEALSRIAQAHLESFDLTSLEVDREVALKSIRDELKESLESLNNAETKNARRDHFKIDGATADHYTEQILSLNNTEHVICGIRHFAGDLSRPFINIEASFQIQTKKDVAQLFHEISSYFNVFKPQHICFFSKDRLDPEVRGNIYYAQIASNIKALSPWPQEVKFTLKKIETENYYSWYAKEYEEFHQSAQELASKVLVNSLDVMEDSRKAGLLYEVLAKGERRGIVAAEKSTLLGQPGLYFNEIYLVKSWRGKGIAKAVQRKFIEICSSDDQIVWGTIDSVNIPSQATARRNNRFSIRHENFFAI